MLAPERPVRGGRVLEPPGRDAAGVPFVADVRRRPRVRLPNTFDWIHARGALLFAAAGGNEANSDTERSSGSIRFLRVRCGRRMRIFRVNARVGSELIDGETLTVRGSFSAST